MNEKIKPLWLTEILGTWKQYVFVIFFLGLYFGSSYLVVADNLFNIAEMNVRDYYDRGHIDTKRMWTDTQIKLQFDFNKEYVRNYIDSYKHKYLDKTKYESSYDHMLFFENFTNFHAVVNNG